VKWEVLPYFQLFMAMAHPWYTALTRFIVQNCTSLPAENLQILEKASGVQKLSVFLSIEFRV